MNGSLGQRIARPARRWTDKAGRQLTLVGSLVAFLLLVAAAPVAAPVAASARPTPGGISDPFGRDAWSGWSVKPPIARPAPDFQVQFPAARHPGVRDLDRGTVHGEIPIATPWSSAGSSR